DDLSLEVSLADLKRIEQGPEQQIEPVAELAKRVEARRKRAMLEAADRVRRQPTTLGEDFLRHAAAASERADMATEASPQQRFCVLLVLGFWLRFGLGLGLGLGAVQFWNERLPECRECVLLDPRAGCEQFGEAARDLEI